LNTEAGALAAIATVVTALIAWRALTATASDSRERSRPVVYAWFRVADHNDRAFDFAVRNYGQSAARDVKVTFDPPFSVEQRRERLAEIVAERWDKTMPFLPPGAEIKNLWWSSLSPSAEEKGARNALNTKREIRRDHPARWAVDEARFVVGLERFESRAANTDR
jgi:hypothetical protein